MSEVRRFVEDDLPQVADLHRRIFRAGDRQAASGGWLDAYRRYFADVFLNATVDASVPGSLVYESDGRILGFLGVVPRRMQYKGKPLLMAVCSQFAVDPAGRGQVGLRMLKRCFQGPQDLSVTDEAGDSTRTIWEWCGGDTVLPCSIRWIRPLRPAQLALSVLADRTSRAFVTGACRPLARLADRAIATYGPAALRVTPPRGVREELDEATFLACLPEITTDRSLAPAYDARSIGWAIQRASHRSDHGHVRKLVVRQEQSDISGWFVYCLSRDRIAEVLQIAARPKALSHVLDHLLDEAMQQGAIAVSGRLEPALVGPVSDKHALFYRGSHWTLVHSTHAHLRHAIHNGDAFLSRLEGEWCLRFP
jgi:hypothetical protein